MQVQVGIVTATTTSWVSEWLYEVSSEKIVDKKRKKIRYQESSEGTWWGEIEIIVSL
jgi:hypothetical protein